MSAEVQDQGWAFLVAAGRQRDHSVLVAPDFLVARGEYGALAEVVHAGREGQPPQTSSLRTADGHPLTLTAVTHLLTPQDVAEPGTRAGPPSSARDEHNRPLRLVVGLVSERPRGDAGVIADLGKAWEVVLPAYRAFLADEVGFGVESSRAFPLRSAAVPVAGEVAPASAPADGVRPTQGRESHHPLQSRPATRPRPRAGVSRALWIVAGSLLALGLGVGSVAGLVSRAQTPQLDDQPSTTSTTSTTTTAPTTPATTSARLAATATTVTATATSTTGSSESVLRRGAQR